jgi:AraC family transcriptional regulator
MLRYLGIGKRSLGEVPMPPHKRLNWEFLAVISGRCAPILEGEQKQPLATDTLWLFPPNCVHGWTGEPQKTCEVMVFHFSTVPQAVERAVQDNAYISMQFLPADRRRLIRLFKELKPHYWRPTLTSDIVAERALMDLGLLILRNLPKGTPRPRNPHLARVLIAENWVREHLAERPTVVRVADVAGISQSQLNRLFIRVRREGPKHVFEKLKMERAMHVMSQSDAKLHNVALECGYSSASNFCRAFRALHGTTPKTWRKETHIQYRKPHPSEKDDYKRNGRALRAIA